MNFALSFLIACVSLIISTVRVLDFSNKLSFLVLIFEVFICFSISPPLTMNYKNINCFLLNICLEIVCIFFYLFQQIFCHIHNIFLAHSLRSIKLMIIHHWHLQEQLKFVSGVNKKRGKNKFSNSLNVGEKLRKITVLRKEHLMLMNIEFFLYIRSFF